MENSLGIYIHIPFCVSKCGYCDFYSLAGCERKMPAYQSALLAHISESAETMKSYEIDTIYFGGGTPSYYGARRIIDVLSEFKRLGNVRLDSEITVEVNPDSTRIDELRRLRRAGVNRLSIGMQSANNDILKIIGRRHNFKQVELAVRSARKAGFDNISLDLIYGLPSQTKGDWADTLAKAIKLHPEHISCYALKLEEGTPLYRYADSPIIPDEDEQADMYMYTVETLKQYGYEQYEISNFAIPGFESRHNLKYWQLGDYMGFGPGAHSMVGDLRYSFIRDLNGYIAGINGETNIIDEHEKIIPIQRAAEYLMLGMRTTRGISKEDYHAIYRSDWAPIEEALRLYEKKGWAERDGDRWHLTPSGFMVSNPLINAVLEAQMGVRAENNPWLKGAFEPKNEELPRGDIEEFEAFYREKSKQGGLADGEGEA